LQLELHDDPLEMARRCRAHAAETQSEEIAAFLSDLAAEYEAMAKRPVADVEPNADDGPDSA
jgi:hypothetical protein